MIITGRNCSPIYKRSEDKDLFFDPHLRSYTQFAKAHRGRGRIQPSRLEGEALRRPGRRRSPAARLLAAEPPPGGLGGGVSYKPDQLLFNNETAAFYYLLVPPSLGQNVNADLIYMTSSNRASKGCEALISYFKDRLYAAAFMIWDWSTARQNDGTQFVVTMDYDELSPYRIPLAIGTTADSPDSTFDAISVSNSTRWDGANWINEVYLHNHSTGIRDQIWQNSFTWPTKATDDNFWWGPIFETFPDNAQYTSAPPLGFAEAMLVQDGLQRQLTPEDSDLTEPVCNGFVTIWKTPNSGLVAQGSNT